MSLRRKCWRYVPVLCTLADIKRGDLYQLQKASADDQLDESQLFLATTDAKPVPPDADPPPAFEGQTMDDLVSYTLGLQGDYLICYNRQNALSTWATK